MGEREERARIVVIAKTELVVASPGSYTRSMGRLPHVPYVTRATSLSQGRRRFRSRHHMKLGGVGTAHVRAARVLRPPLYGGISLMR